MTRPTTQKLDKSTTVSLWILGTLLTATAGGDGTSDPQVAHVCADFR